VAEKLKYILQLNCFRELIIWPRHLIAHWIILANATETWLQTFAFAFIWT